MDIKDQFDSALHDFCKDAGVTYTLAVDPSGEQTKKCIRRFCHQVDTTLNILEEWEIRAELYVGLFKEVIKKNISQTKCPLRLWEYCAHHVISFS